MACPSPTPPTLTSHRGLSFPSIPPSRKAHTWRGIQPREKLEAARTDQGQSGPPSAFYLGDGGEEEEEKDGRDWREVPRRGTALGSKSGGGSQGWERIPGVRGLVRVVGCFCRLPVAPRQSRSRAAEPFKVFRRDVLEGGAGAGPVNYRGASYTPLPGQVLSATRRAPIAAAGRTTPGGSQGPGPSHPPLPLLAAARSPVSPDLSPPQGAGSKLPLPFDSPGSQRRKDWRVLAEDGRHQRCRRWRARTACAGNRLLVAARLERSEPEAARQRGSAGEFKCGPAVRSQGLCPRLASPGPGVLGKRLPPSIQQQEQL